MFKKLGIFLIIAISLGFAFLVIFSNFDETKNENLNNKLSAGITT